MKALLRSIVPSALVLVLSSVIPCTLAASSPTPRLSPGPHDVQISDVRLHYYVTGTGPLVIVPSPGWGVGSAYLINGLAPLEKHFTMLYLDTRGSGLSSQPADRNQMSTAVMADDIDQLRIYLGLSSIRLVGHSNGGRAVLHRSDHRERDSKNTD